MEDNDAKNRLRPCLSPDPRSAPGPGRLAGSERARRDRRHPDRDRRWRQRPLRAEHHCQGQDARLSRPAGHRAGAPGRLGARRDCRRRRRRGLDPRLAAGLSDRRATGPRPAAGNRAAAGRTPGGQAAGASGRPQPGPGRVRQRPPAPATRPRSSRHHPPRLSSRRHRQSRRPALARATRPRPAIPRAPPPRPATMRPRWANPEPRRRPPRSPPRSSRRAARSRPPTPPTSHVSARASTI